MTALNMLVPTRRRQLPGRLDLVAPALRALVALGGTATADEISRAVIAACRISKRASRVRTRKDRRPFVVHETQFALNLLSNGLLVRFVEGFGWQITPDGERLLAEGFPDSEIVEIVRAARRKKTVGVPVPIVGLRELPIPPRGMTADPTPCTYALQSVTGGDIKIGRSTLGRLWERTDENDSRGEPLRITRLFAGGRPTERGLHLYFRDLRRRSNREWFRSSAELAQLVYAIPEPPNPEQAA